jgi:hypothetical protein
VPRGQLDRSLRPYSRLSRPGGTLTGCNKLYRRVQTAVYGGHGVFMGRIISSIIITIIIIIIDVYTCISLHNG